MKRLAACAVLSMFALGAFDAEAVPEGWYHKVSEARHAALESGNFILVDLYADWCGWCRRLEKDVFSHPTFDKYAEKFVKLKVNVEDGAEGTALQNRYRAGSLPTTLLLTPKMVLVDMIQGYSPRGDFMRRLEESLAFYEREQDHYENLLRSKDPEVLLSVAEELHERGDGERAGRTYRRILEYQGIDTWRRTWVLFRLADTQRLEGDFDGAYRSLHESRRYAERNGEHEHLEACDLLRIQIAQDRGLCTATVAALETFLENHPSSGYRNQARRSLARLNRSECT